MKTVFVFISYILVAGTLNGNYSNLSFPYISNMLKEARKFFALHHVLTAHLGGPKWLFREFAWPVIATESMSD